MALLIQKLKYGAFITVSSIAILTGTLWYDRDSSAVKTEDKAALYGRMVETVVAYQTGTNDVPVVESWPPLSTYMAWYPGYTVNGTNFWNEYEGTNAVQDPITVWTAAESFYGVHNVHNFQHWSFTYDHILNSARDLVLAYEGGLFWVDGATLPADGGDLVSAAANMSVVVTPPEPAYFPTDIAYTMHSPSNGWQQHVGTTGTRQRKPGVTRFRSNLTDSAPLASYFLGAATDALPFAVTNNPPWPSWNWWTDKTGLTNAYRYACEHDKPEADIINVTPTEGAYFSISPAQLTFPYGQHALPQDINVKSKSSVSNVLHAETFTLTYEGGGGGATLVVGDGNHSGVLDWLVLSARVAPVNEGGSTGIGIKLKDNPGTGLRYVDITATGVGITVSPNQMIFGGNNYNTYQTLTVSAPEDVDKAPPVATIALSYRSFTGPVLGVQTLAAGGTDNDGSQDGVIITPVLTSLAPLASNDVEVTLGSVYTNFVTFVDQRQLTSTLNNAKAVLTNLITTMHVMAPYEATFLTTPKLMNYSGEYSTNYNTSDLPFEFDNDSWYDPLMASRVKGSDTTITEWDGTILDVTSQSDTINYHQYITSVPPTNIYYSSVIGNYSMSALYKTEMMLPYPSKYACASGYVDRIRVYIVAKCSPAQPKDISLIPIDPNEDPDGRDVLNSFSPDLCGISWYTNKSGLAGCSGYGPQVMIRDYSVNTHITESSLANPYITEIKWTLLADVTSPTNCPIFELGFDDGYAIDRAWYHGTYTDLTQHFLGTDAYTQHYDYTQEYVNKASVLYFVVVVDWNFKYMKAPLVTNDPDWTKPPE